MILLALACSTELMWSETERSRILTLSPLPPLPARPSNRWADDPAAAKLGETLFFDDGFSVDGSVSCANCHRGDLHFTDGLTTAAGVGKGARNTPSLLAAPWSEWLFWDGRADSLWAQARGPVLHPLEHGMSEETLVARVREVYTEPWATVFGGVPEDPLAVMAQFGKAIEAFERGFAPPETRFDLFVAGLRSASDDDSLSAEEKRGLRLFIGRAGCVDCHFGPLFTDDNFHNLALPTARAEDLGRAAGVAEVRADPLNCLGQYSDGGACLELRYVDPAFPDFAGAFKTPSLRQVAQTAPYMHDGSFGTIEGVLAFYQALPGTAAVGHRELTLKPLALPPEDLAALAAFLRTL